MLILASASPARSQLLTQWGIQHQVIPANIDEDVYKHSILDPKTLVETLARAKASSLSTNHQALTTTILAADTIIVLNDKIIGKPSNRRDAKRIITLLQGQTHQVWTGVCIIFTKHQAPTTKHLLSDMASVTLKPMTDSDIETYLDSNDWQGAAGAYRIQFAIKPYVQTFIGDINTIIGLPHIVKEKLIPVQNSFYNKD